MSGPGPAGKPLRIAVAGLGIAGALMVPAIRRHGRVRLAGAADPNPELRRRFEQDCGMACEEDIEGLLRRTDVDAVYIATPHQLHREQAILAARSGKHMIVEKPMALDLRDCHEMAAQARRHGVRLIVGHTHGFDPAVQYLRRITTTGELGALAMLAMWNYTDFMYRPRRPEELDTARGGGVLFNQLPHHVDMARVIADRPVRSVRAMAGILDRRRPTEGCYSVMLGFEGGAAASMVYSGYDRFDSNELHGWIGSSGRPRPARHGQTRQAFENLQTPQQEVRLRQDNYGYGGGFVTGEATHQEHFGLVVATYENGDARVTPAGVGLYTAAGARQVALPVEQDARAAVLDELYEAVALGAGTLHDSAFATETLRVCLAVRDSVQTQREVFLEEMPVP